MHATIVYFSSTGRNEQMAKAVERELAGDGYETKLISLKPKKTIGATMGSLMAMFGRTVELVGDITVPEGDMLVLVSPTWAGYICPPMLTFLKQLPDLGGRKVINLVCSFNPHPNVEHQIDKMVKAHKSGPIVSRAIRLKDIDNPEKTAAKAKEIVDLALSK